MSPLIALLLAAPLHGELQLAQSEGFGPELPGAEIAVPGPSAPAEPAASDPAAVVDPEAQPPLPSAPPALAVPGPSKPAPDAPPLELVINPTFSMDSGSVSLLGLRQLAFLHDDAVRRWMVPGEGTWLRRAAGMASRAVKWALIDWPLVTFSDTVLHEAYGHGARAREGGAKPYYELELPWPYRALSSRKGIAGLTYAAYTGNPELDTQMVAAGIEVELLHAHQVNLQLMQRGARAPYWDLLAYVDLKIAYATVLLFQDLSVSTPAAGDPDQYLALLSAQFNRWRPVDRVTLARGLQRTYLWNFVDPTLAVAVYRLLVDYFVFGETDLSIPTLEVNGIRLLPATRFNLSPFGPEVMAELLASRGGAAGALTLRTGVGGVANTFGLSAEVVGVRARPWLQLGADADVWLQPALLFDQRYAFSRPVEAGGRIALSAAARLYGSVGLTAKLGIKSRGYVPGQPLPEGVSGFLGLAIWPGGGGLPLLSLKTL